MPRKYRLSAQGCAVLVDDGLARVIGGQTLGWPLNHKSQYIVSRGLDGVSRPCVGVQFIIPRDPNDAATHYDSNDKPTRDHSVTLKLFHGTFSYSAQELPQHVRDTLPTIMRTPTRAADRVTVICLTLKDGHRAVLDGFGIPTSTANPADFDALFLGGNFDGVKPLLDLAAQRQFMIIIPDESPQKHPRNWFMDDMSPDASDLFHDYQDRATEYPAKIFRFDNPRDCQIALEQGTVQDVFEQRRLNAINSAFSQAGLSLVPSAHADDSAQRKAEIAKLTHEARFMHLCKRDLFTGSGFFTTLSPAAADVDGLATALGGLALSAPIGLSVPIALPLISPFGPMSYTDRAACLNLIDRTIRSSLVEYLESVRLGVFALIGCAGSGKTRLLAGVTTILWMNPTIGMVYGAAPTDVAVTNLTIRCFGMMKSVAERLPGGHLRRYLPVVVRGHAMESEISAFLQHGGHPWVPATMWDSIWPRLSPAFWLWLTLKMPSVVGSLPICPRLAEVKKCIREDTKYRGLRAWVNRPLDTSTIDGGGQQAVEDLVLELLTQIVLAADIVLTTPHTSGDRQYAAFNSIAKAVVLDEAGAMLQADALQVWGEGCRVCVLAGDDKQEPAMTMATNPFAQLARVSVLKQFKRTSWPCFDLTGEHRVVTGTNAGGELGRD